jgi:hypothetical protein
MKGEQAPAVRLSDITGGAPSRNEGVRGAEGSSGVFSEEARVTIGDPMGQVEAVVGCEESQDPSTLSCRKPPLLEEFLAHKRNVIAPVLRTIEETLRMGESS